MIENWRLEIDDLQLKIEITIVIIMSKKLPVLMMYIKQNDLEEINECEKDDNSLRKKR